MGISGTQSYLVAQRNLVVEGVDDYWVLSELSNLFVRSGALGLPEDILVTAAGGASEAAYIATFMIGQKLDVVVVLDSDQAGDTARDSLVKKWLTRYNGKETQVLSLGACAAVQGEFSIEDLFTEDFYLARVKQAYAKQLSAVGSELKLRPGAQLCKRVERAFGELGLAFNKGSVAKLIRAELTRMKSISELPGDTKKRAEGVLAAIRNAFGSLAAST
jgi:hypothetical protein